MINVRGISACFLNAPTDNIDGNTLVARSQALDAIEELERGSSAVLGVGGVAPQ
jgi:hypothetical protein